MNWFEFLEEYDIVNKYNGAINGCVDEWYEGMQLGNKFRMALCMEDDENYDILDQEKYQGEFIFCVMKWIILGGGMSQMENKMAEYNEACKMCYKDLVSVAKSPETGEIQATSFVYKI